VVALYREPRAIGRPIRFTIQPPESGMRRVVDLAASRDGRRVAFVAFGAGDEEGTLWVRSLDSLMAQKLPGTEDATFPFWSPDSQTVAFFAQKKLKKIGISGGVVQALCDAPTGRGGTWNRDGAIVFAPEGLGALARVSGDGGVPVP